MYFRHISAIIAKALPGFACLDQKVSYYPEAFSQP